MRAQQGASHGLVVEHGVFLPFLFFMLELLASFWRESSQSKVLCVFASPFARVRRQKPSGDFGLEATPRALGPTPLRRRKSEGASGDAPCVWPGSSASPHARPPKVLR